jgi:hypothetical protein
MVSTHPSGPGTAQEQENRAPARRLPVISDALTGQSSAHYAKAGPLCSTWRQSALTFLMLPPLPCVHFFPTLQPAAITLSIFFPLIFFLSCATLGTYQRVV